MNRNTHSALWLILVTVSCSQPVDVPSSTTACDFESVHERFQCGTAGVPFAVWRSLSARPLGDPLIVLTGRLGSEPLGTAVRFRSAFERVRRRRDVVFVGAPNTPPVAACELQAGAPVAKRYAFLPSPECATALSASGVRGGIAVEHVESVRRKLNVARLNLWAEGASARTALAYAAAFPGTVNALIVDGVPPRDSLSQTFAMSTARVRDAIVERCAADAPCAATYPNLRGSLAELLIRKNRSIELEAAHPVTGVRQREQLPPEAVELALTALLELKQGPSALPRAIHELRHGRRELLLGLATALRFGLPTESVPAGVLAEWKTDLPQPMRRLEVPTLFLSAEFDPFFTQESAEAALQNAPRGRHVHVSGATRRVSDVGCGPLALEAFVGSADVMSKALDCWTDLALDFEGASP